jgi:hypothetical protein
MDPTWYSLKLYDGHFLKLKKTVLEKRFKDGVVLADNHFKCGKTLFKKISENGSGKKELLCEKHRSYNSQHQAARARVEAPNGILKCSNH